MSGVTDTNPNPSRNASFTTERYPLLLFYDGDCSFCARWVERVKKADAAMRRMRYGQQQGPTFRRVKQLHPELAKIESVVLLKRRPDGGDDVFVRSEAIHEAIRGLHEMKFFDSLLDIVPKSLADFGYNFIARERGRLFGAWHDDRPSIETDKELYVE
jgi:predicted DCC family thiol-disulfide oxidoreductase YuxK